MLNGKGGFIKGFVLATVLCGAGAVFAVGEIYTPNPEGDWIRDTGKYATGTADQVNVLGDLQPGAPDIMFQVALRLNVLASAGKKQSWDLAAFEADEISESFGRLMTTRPTMTTDLTNFITANLDPVITAIGNKDKMAFGTSLDTMVAACTTCHVNSGVGFLVVKPTKSALPVK